MHGFLGFLSTMILLLAMVNHAHADTGWNDAEGLRAEMVLEAMEPKEITIYILGDHKEVAAALLEAVDEETPVTGIADFDSLSSAYGLMGIYRKGRRSSGFYGHRFRLKFSPTADVSAIVRSYWNLPYIKSVEPEPRVRKVGYQGRGRIMRVADILIPSALIVGVLILLYQIISVGPRS
ncbi:MAG: hypothetical protein F4X83_05495 [Chloroflexi bacterium]|nr:hypothetical protein [Chloroflexota bacterium]